jgi:hypothetical protein
LEAQSWIAIDYKNGAMAIAKRKELRRGISYDGLARLTTGRSPDQRETLEICND